MRNYREIIEADVGKTLFGPVNFIPLGTSGLLQDRYFYRKVGFRAPKKGEWYLSGAIIEAYRAPNDLTTPYQVVEKVSRVVRRTIEVNIPCKG